MSLPSYIWIEEQFFFIRKTRSWRSLCRIEINMYFLPFYPSTARQGKFVRNRKGGVNLLYGGFVYRKKAEYKNTINWVCAKAPTRDSNNRLILCYGRCVTDEDCHVRLSKKGHNHPPVDLNMFEDTKQVFDDAAYGNFIIQTEVCDTVDLEQRWFHLLVQ